MNERRNSYPILLPAGKKWKALFGFLGFSGLVTSATLLIGGGRAWNKWDTMQDQLDAIQRQYATQLKLDGEFRGRIAELTTSENQLRSILNLPPLVHQSILDGGSDTGDHRSAPRPHEELRAVLPVVPVVERRGPVE